MADGIEDLRALIESVQNGSEPVSATNVQGGSFVGINIADANQSAPVIDVSPVITNSSGPFTGIDISPTITTGGDPGADAQIRAAITDKLDEILKELQSSKPNQGNLSKLFSALKAIAPPAIVAAAKCALVAAGATLAP